MPLPLIMTSVVPSRPPCATHPPERDRYQPWKQQQLKIHQSIKVLRFHCHQVTGITMRTDAPAKAKIESISIQIIFQFHQQRPMKKRVIQSVAHTATSLFSTEQAAKRKAFHLISLPPSEKRRAKQKRNSGIAMNEELNGNNGWL